MEPLYLVVQVGPLVVDDELGTDEPKEHDPRLRTTRTAYDRLVSTFKKKERERGLVFERWTGRKQDRQRDHEELGQLLRRDDEVSEREAGDVDDQEHRGAVPHVPPLVEVRGLHAKIPRDRDGAEQDHGREREEQRLERRLCVRERERERERVRVREMLCAACLYACMDNNNSCASY